VSQAVARRAEALVQQVMASDKPPARAWDDAFRGARYASPVLAEAVYILHRAGQYDVAVEGLLSSLRNDHSQPWTYDVLAAEMGLAKRPAADIERVLVSRIDFGASDISQMMVTAAMLSRMNVRKPAIKLCRQAAELEPFLPEPWLLGRNIADSAEQTDAQVWARCGIIRYVHSGAFSADRREARETLLRLIDVAERNGDNRRGSDIRERLHAADAVDLRIVLRWVGAADLDLLVDEPGGARCDLRQRLTRAGGHLIREDGGMGKRTNGQRIEEYICHTAASGTYTAAVRFVFGKVVAGTAVLEVIRHENTSRESRTSTTIALSRKDTRLEIVLDDGRGKLKSDSD
jgi:tetratricopeptide (TPR) repeat protein